jgi:hypothetical protein
MGKGPERKIQDAILRFLELQDIKCWHVRNGGTYDPVRKIFRSNSSIKGLSDIQGWIKGDGRFLAIEVKSEKGKLTPEQKDFIAEAAEDGCVAGVARSVDDVKNILIGAGICLRGGTNGER